MTPYPMATIVGRLILKHIVLIWIPIPLNKCPRREVLPRFLRDGYGNRPLVQLDSSELVIGFSVFFALHIQMLKTCAMQFYT